MSNPTRPDPDPTDPDASTAQKPEMQSSGLSFEAEPTGLGATDTPATTDEGDPERFDTSQGAATSRPGFTPGEQISEQDANQPRGLSGMVLVGILVILVLLIILALL